MASALSVDGEISTIQCELIERKEIEVVSSCRECSGSGSCRSIEIRGSIRLETIGFVGGAIERHTCGINGSTTGYAQSINIANIGQIDIKAVNGQARQAAGAADGIREKY